MSGKRKKSSSGLVTANPAIPDAHIECRFVVPGGSRFIQALGWRRQLVGTVRDIEEIAPADISRKAMIEVLLESRRVRQKAAVERP